ncbi:MAG: hypothetical protein JJ893_16870, partial [Thalassospira sp.]|nr:hypothetical protein [Thalassospira sp.]
MFGGLSGLRTFLALGCGILALESLLFFALRISYLGTVMNRSKFLFLRTRGTVLVVRQFDQFVTFAILTKRTLEILCRGLVVKITPTFVRA